MRVFSQMIVVIVALLTLGRESTAQAPEFRPEELLPRRDTWWELQGAPAVGAMRDSIVAVLAQCETQFWGGYGEPVQGFVAGHDYPMIFIRDTSTLLQTASYFYPRDRLVSAVDEFLRRQYGPDTRSDEDGTAAGEGAISAIVAPDGHIDKATAVSDEELHLIHAAYVVSRAGDGEAWLRSPIRGTPTIERLNGALDWLVEHRQDPATGLIRRSHTTDWGDVKMEAAANPTDADPIHDVWTASIYDQALAYRGLRELAEMNRAVGRQSTATMLDKRADDLRGQVQRYLWQPQQRFFRTHLHLTPFDHPFDESTILSIANAIAVDCGLADEDQTLSIFDELEQARLAAGAAKPGVVLYPPYPAGSFAAPQMAPGRYQNGALWDWWAGWQVLAEFRHGAAGLARDHLLAIADDWGHHAGEIWEWQTVTGNEGHGPSDYGGAAGTVGEAVIRGLFGITLDARETALAPRLGDRSGYVRAYHAASDRYAAYRYTVAGDAAYLDYGVSNVAALNLAILLPVGRELETAAIDGIGALVEMQTVGRDRYALLQGPGGVHRVEIRFR